MLVQRSDLFFVLAFLIAKEQSGLTVADFGPERLPSRWRNKVRRIRLRVIALTNLGWLNFIAFELKVDLFVCLAVPSLEVNLIKIVRPALYVLILSDAKRLVIFFTL